MDDLRVRSWQIGTACVLVLLLLLLSPSAGSCWSCDRQWAPNAGTTVAIQAFGLDLAPVAGIGVSILKFGRTANSLTSVCSGKTDARGFFRCPTLPPGRYVLRGLSIDAGELTVDERPAELWVVRWDGIGHFCEAPRICSVKMQEVEPLAEAPPCVRELGNPSR